MAWRRDAPVAILRPLGSQHLRQPPRQLPPLPNQCAQQRDVCAAVPGAAPTSVPQAVVGRHRLCGHIHCRELVVRSGQPRGGLARRGAPDRSWALVDGAMGLPGNRGCHSVREPPDLPADFRPFDMVRQPRIDRGRNRRCHRAVWLFHLASAEEIRLNGGLHGEITTGPSIMTISLTRLFGLIGEALIAVAALLAAALPAAAETAEARPAASQKADALLSGLIETNDPGLAVLVAQNGKILFEKSYGLADREHHVPVIPQTTFRIGSIGKQFTASAILKLQEEGKLSINDKLSKYTPDFPRGDEVTLRHLLTHTSGIHSYTDKDDFMGRVTS